MLGRSVCRASEHRTSLTRFPQGLFAIPPGYHGSDGPYYFYEYVRPAYPLHTRSHSSSTSRHEQSEQSTAIRQRRVHHGVLRVVHVARQVLRREHQVRPE